MIGSLSIGDPRLATEFDEVLAEAIADDHAEDHHFTQAQFVRLLTP